MKIILNKNKLLKFIHNDRNLGFVPTMGAIHQGHISLIKKSISQCKKTIVSIFINKPQFNKIDDYNRYPRNLKKDIKILKMLKVDYLYLPTSNEIYPFGTNNKIKVNSFERKLCGKFRPGHFKSIADVVDRFLKIIKPNKVYFGKKDFQQLIIIKDFVMKNHPKIKVIGCKTIREKNGIAHSSRNLLLSTNEKKIAARVYKFLLNKKKLISRRIISSNFIKKKIYNLGVNKIDYIEILDINKILHPYKKKIEYKIFIAYYLGKTRLIDNF